MPQNKGKMNNNKSRKNTVQKARKTIPRLPLTFVPMRSMRTHVLFKQEKTITEGAAGVGGAAWYRINGAFDPDAAALGPSALGFNQYAALFTSYRVLACRVHVEGCVGFAGTSGSNTFAIVSITPNPRQQTLPADPALWGGEPGAISKAYAPGAYGGRNVVVLDKTFIPWDVLKVTKQQYMDETDYSSLITTTPVKELYFAIGVNAVLAGGVATLAAIVTISYEVEFFEPNLLV